MIPHERSSTVSNGPQYAYADHSLSHAPVVVGEHHLVRLRLHREGGRGDVGVAVVGQHAGPRVRGSALDAGLVREGLPQRVRHWPRPRTEVRQAAGRVVDSRIGIRIIIEALHEKK